MKMSGSNVVIVSKEKGRFKKCIELLEKLSTENNIFFTNQMRIYILKIILYQKI